MLFIGSAYLLLRARKVEFISAKRILQGYALFGICFAFTRIFFLLATYALQVQAGYVSGSQEYIIQFFMDSIWVSSAHGVTVVSLVFIFRVVEHYMLNRKPIFTIVAFLSLCFHLLAIFLIMFDFVSYLTSSFNMPIYLFQLQVQNYEPVVQDIMIPVLGIAILVLYLVIAKGTAGSLRKKSLETFIGILLLIFGLIFNLSIFSADFFLILAPILFISGTALVFYSVR